MSLGLLGLGTLSTAQNLGNWGLGQVSASASDRRSYKYTKRLLRMQQEFAREMASTAHQLEVADLKAAGLNPILSAGGSGAHASVGGAPSVGGSNGSAPSGDIVGDVMQYATAQQAISSAKTSQALQTEQIATEKAKQQELNAQTSANASKSLLDRAQAAEISSGLPNNRLIGNALKNIEGTGFWNAIAEGRFSDAFGLDRKTSAKAQSVSSKASPKRQRKTSGAAPSAKQQQAEYHRLYNRTFEDDNHSLNRSDHFFNSSTGFYERR